MYQEPHSTQDTNAQYVNWNKHPVPIPPSSRLIHYELQHSCVTSCRKSWCESCWYSCNCEGPPIKIHFSIYLTGWVVTWFLLGYTVRMFEYTVRTFRSNVGRFLYVFSSIPRKLYTIFQPTFSPIKRYQDSIFKLLTLSTNSVTNVVRTAYFQIQARSSLLKNLWQSLYSK